MVRVLALLFIVAVSDAWSNGSANYNVQLTRDEAIHLLAEGAARSPKNLAPESPVDQAAVEKAKRGIATQLQADWRIRFVDRDDCTILVYLHKPGEHDTGFSVRVDQNKRLVDFLQHR